MLRPKPLRVWSWRSVALACAAWLVAYGAWLVLSVRSVAEGLAKTCAADRWGCNILVVPDWWDWYLWLVPPVLLLIVRWWLGRRPTVAA